MAFCCYRKYLDKESKEWNHIIRRKSGVFRKTARVGRPFAREWSSFNGGTSETGLVGDVTGNCVSVPVRMTAGKELVTDDAVMFLNDCREASAEQKIALQRLLNEGYLAWDKRRGVCSNSLCSQRRTVGKTQYPG
ncbi:hypothetical protein NXW09_29125 [Bacteroides ovatus]|nr:hypothetical protein [Bacteroides ovatus]